MYAERESVEVIVHYCTVCMDDIHLVYGAMFVLFIEHKQKQKNTKINVNGAGYGGYGRNHIH